MRTFLHLPALGLLLFPAPLFARTIGVGLPDTPCDGLVGCTDSGGSVEKANFIADSLPQVAELLILVAAALSVLFIVYAGFRMVIALGDESQITEQKNAVIYVMVGLATVILAQLVVSFVGTQDYGQNDPSIWTANNDFFLYITKEGISILLTLFNAAMVVAIIVGGGYMVHAQGKSDQFTKGKTIVTWTIIGAVIANLANALVQALVRLLS